MQGEKVRLILASTSPRRQRLLEKAGIEVEVKSVPVDEDQVRAPTPHELVMARARLKAEASAAALDPHFPGFVIGADTVVVLHGEVLGKPRDEADARRMLTRLSGRTHQVITGVAVRPAGIAVGPTEGTERPAGGGVQPGLVPNLKAVDLPSERKRYEGGILVAYQTTDVTMGVLSPPVIEGYAATGEPLDKAGGYGIQERGGFLVKRIAGDYFNVVGLPLALLRDMLAAFGVELLQQTNPRSGSR